MLSLGGKGLSKTELYDLGPGGQNFVRGQTGDHQRLAVPDPTAG